MQMINQNQQLCGKIVHSVRWLTYRDKETISLWQYFFSHVQLSMPTCGPESDELLLLQLLHLVAQLLLLLAQLLLPPIQPARFLLSALGSSRSGFCHRLFYVALYLAYLCLCGVHQRRATDQLLGQLHQGWCLSSCDPQLFTRQAAATRAGDSGEVPGRTKTVVPEATPSLFEEVQSLDGLLKHRQKHCTRGRLLRAKAEFSQRRSLRIWVLHRAANPLFKELCQETRRQSWQRLNESLVAAARLTR